MPHSLFFFIACLFLTRCASLLKKSLPNDGSEELSCLSCWLKFYAIAQISELTNEPFLIILSFLLLKESFSSLLVDGVIAQHMIDNDQDAVSNSYRSSFRPSSISKTTILCCKITVLLMRGRMSRLDEEAS